MTELDRTRPALLFTIGSGPSPGFALPEAVAVRPEEVPGPRALDDFRKGRGGGGEGHRHAREGRRQEAEGRRGRGGDEDVDTVERGGERGGRLGGFE